MLPTCCHFRLDLARGDLTLGVSLLPTRDFAARGCVRNGLRGWLLVRAEPGLTGLRGEGMRFSSSSAAGPAVWSDLLLLRVAAARDRLRDRWALEDDLGISAAAAEPAGELLLVFTSSPSSDGLFLGVESRSRVRFFMWRVLPAIPAASRRASLSLLCALALALLRALCACLSFSSSSFVSFGGTIGSIRPAIRGFGCESRSTFSRIFFEGSSGISPSVWPWRSA